MAKTASKKSPKRTKKVLPAASPRVLKGKDPVVPVRLPAKLISEIDTMAKATDTTRSEIIRTGAEREIKRRTRKTSGDAG